MFNDQWQQPQQHDIGDLIAEYVRYEVNRNNPLGQIAHHVLSVQGGNNQAMRLTAQRVSDDRGQGTIHNKVKRWVNYLVAEVVATNQQLRQGLPQQTLQFLQQVYTEGSNALGLNNNIYQPNQQWDGSTMQQQPIQQTWGASPQAQPMQQAWSGTQQQPMTTGFETPPSSSNGITPRTVIAQTPSTAQPVHTEQQQTIMEPTPTANPTPMFTHAPVNDDTWYDSDGNVLPEGIVLSNPRPYDLFVKDGELWEPRAFSARQLTNRKLPTICDPRVRIPFYVTDKQGNTREEILPVDLEMEYLANELLPPHIRAQVREEKAKPNPLVDSLLRSKRKDVTTDKPKRIIKDAPLMYKKPVSNEATLVDNLDTAGRETQLNAVAEDLSVCSSKYVLMKETLYRPTENVDLCSIPVSPAQYAGEMQRLRDVVGIDQAAVRFINNSVTKAVNIALSSHNTGISIDSSIDDLRELMDYIQNNGVEKVSSTSLVRSLTDAIKGALPTSDDAVSLVVDMASEGTDLSDETMERIDKYHSLRIMTPIMMVYVDRDLDQLFPGLESVGLNKPMNIDVLDEVIELLGNICDNAHDVTYVILRLSDGCMVQVSRTDYAVTLISLG